MRKSVQAKHIDDVCVLDVIRAVSVASRRRHVSLWDVSERLAFPEKVVRAKLRSMVRRGVVDGCACGCRGDFTIPS